VHPDSVRRENHTTPTSPVYVRQKRVGFFLCTPTLIRTLVLRMIALVVVLFVAFRWLLFFNLLSSYLPLEWTILRVLDFFLAHHHRLLLVAPPFSLFCLFFRSLNRLSCGPCLHSYPRNHGVLGPHFGNDFGSLFFPQSFSLSFTLSSFLTFCSLCF